MTTETELDNSITTNGIANAEKLLKNISKSVSSIEDKNISIIAIPQHKAKGLPEFCMIFCDGFLKAIEEHNLQMRDFKVLLKYASLMEYGNEIKVTQTEIAQELNLSKPAVSTAVKHLLQANLLIKDESNKLLMNWRLLAKGKLKTFQDEEKKESSKRSRRVNVNIKNARVINIAGSIVTVDKESCENINNKDYEDDLPF